MTKLYGYYSGHNLFKIFFKAMLVTILVVALSQIFSFSIRYASGQPFTAFLFLMNSVLPVLTAFPISTYIFIQNEKLKKTAAELAEANRLLRIRADTDSMTGLLNRNAFLQRIKPLNKSSQQAALLVVDADNFKNINDAFGHQAGDTALKAIVFALRSQLNKNHIIGRIGGEEFAIFLPDTSSSNALRIAEKLRIAVEQIRFKPANNALYPLSISIGIAMSSGTAASSSTFTTAQLMRMADQSLYQAKAKGRNQVVMNAESLHASSKSASIVEAPAKL